MHCPCRQFDAALVGHPDHGGIDSEQCHDRLREDVERRLQREALSERARDLELRVQSLGRFPLRAERLLQLAAECRRTLVQTGVLDRDGELSRERNEERALVRAQRPRLTRIDGEQADRLVADDEREGERRIDPRLGHLRPRRLEPLVDRGIVDLDDAPRLARRERGGEQHACHRLVGTVDALARSHGDPAVVLAEVDGDAVGTEHVAETLDRRVERVRQREPCNCLADDREQRTAPLELQTRLTRPLGRAKCMSSADGKARELRNVRFVRGAAGSEAELQRAERRLAELKRDELSLPPVALDRDRAVLVEDPLRHALQVRIDVQRAVRSVDLEHSAPEPPETCALRP